MNINSLRNRHFFILDIILLTAASYLSFVLRLERLNITPFWQSGIIFTITAVTLIPLSLLQLGMYAQYWQYASIEELSRLILSVTSGTIIATIFTAGILWLLPTNYSFPRSIPVIFILLAIAVTTVPRLTIRAITTYRKTNAYNGSCRNVLIIGAGEAGVMIARELQRADDINIRAIGFIDDDARKHNMNIRGLPVLGNRDDIPTLAKIHHIDQVIIAMPAASGKNIREIIRICETAKVEAKTMPGLYELIDGSITINQLRDVQIGDLLRRKPIQTDVTAVSQLLKGKTILVTGGGGSIGSELCRQIIHSKPEQLILLGHGENSIFEIYHELLRRKLDGVTITAVIADTRFPDRINAIFAEHQPNIVFHAAAHKHVPLMERNPSEAISTNVIGTQNLLHAALAVGVDRFIMISTDKAVNPTSVMGSSKRAAELLVHHAAEESKRPFAAVRFGNVLGSRGSVVLTFQKQIATGGPVTVTDPDMRRFFMTIPEAVQLVLQAAVLADGGEVFLLDMGEPVKIVDLARDLIELSGMVVGRDIDIEYSGMRPGEKLFEELFIEGEKYERTKHEKIFIAQNASSFVPDDIETAVSTLEAAANTEDNPAIITALQHLIPEYTPMRQVL